MDKGSSPQSVLPRRSRGLDFSRAATNLHHSISAEHPASESTSPLVTQRTFAQNVPSTRKRSANGTPIEGPTLGPGFGSTLSSSLGNNGGNAMMLSFDESDTSDSDDEDVKDMQDHDEILATPNLHRKSSSVHIATPTPNSPGLWQGLFGSLGGNNFVGFRKTRLRESRSRQSSSSASAHSGVPSPSVPVSPGFKTGDGYFPKSNMFKRPGSRRESISQVTNELNISSGNDSGDEAHRPGIIRRPVSRRTNMLPKTRAFGRIKAELIEESKPVESELKREADVIRQVLESDLGPPKSATTMSSPSLQPIIQSLENISEDRSLCLDNYTNDFATMVRTSGTKDFWESLSSTGKMTPPPPNGRNSSGGEEMIVDSPVISQSSGLPFFPPGYAVSEPSRASTPQPVNNASGGTGVPPTAADGLRKQGKRRRDDDLDAFSLKRRAVSPGVSVTNSPVLSQSPRQRGNGSISDLWDRAIAAQQSGSTSQSSQGQIKVRERANSVSSVIMVPGTPNLGAKRVGLTGMNDMQGLTEKMTLE